MLACPVSQPLTKCSRVAEASLDAWYRIAKRADWSSLADTRRDFPHADAVGTCTVFNIKDNRYRLVAKIYYDHRKLLIRQVLTHRDYDRGSWKNDCGS